MKTPSLLDSRKIVTLPVEFDASKRALVMLGDYGILGTDESGKAKKVLNAAAMTYVLAALGSFVTSMWSVLSRGAMQYAMSMMVIPLPFPYGTRFSSMMVW